MTFRVNVREKTRTFDSGDHKIKERGSVDEAVKLATSRHGLQQHGSISILGHLSDVAINVSRHHAPLFCSLDIREIMAVAWLHDIIEDTDTTIEEIRDMFGPRIAEAVGCLTDAPGDTREQRHLNTYWRIRNNPNALLVKLCDRRHNHARSLKYKERFTEMYLSEYKYFKFALWDPIKFAPLWAELDDQYEQMKKAVLL